MINFLQGNDNDQQTKDLLKHINKLLTTAKAGKPTEKLNKCWRYYTGSFDNTDKTKNQRNVIQPIIETKTTLIEDAQIVTSIIPQFRSLQDLQQLEEIQEIADILDDCNKNVMKINKFDSLREQVIRYGKIFGISAMEVVWDDEFNEAGDIKLNFIDPRNLYPDMAAKKIDDCNYIFISEDWSPISLRSKYPQYADKINKLLNIGTESQDYTDKNPSGAGAVQFGNSSQMVYKYKDNSYLSGNAKNIKVWKCYLKDDSTFLSDIIDNKNNSDENKQNLSQEAARYPYGRVIIFIDQAKDFILEDKEIDYPFGYPIDVFIPLCSDNLFGISETENLFEIQDRINRAYNKMQQIVGSSNKWILNFVGSGINAQSFLTGKNVINNVIQGKGPEILDNFSLDDLAEILKQIEMLKADALEIARINQQMLSGERQVGVNSKAQIQALNESPMASIRSDQRSLKEFLVEVTKKGIALIQKYYNTPRILLLADGSRYAQIFNNPDGGTDISIKEQQDGILQEVKTIQGGFSTGRYDVDIVAGTEMPRSPQERAQLTLQLKDMGLLPAGLDGAKIILDSLDVPNKKAIITGLEAQQEASNKAPMPTADKINSVFQYLPAWAQIQWLQNNGWQIPQGVADELVNPAVPISDQGQHISKQGVDNVPIQTEPQI